MALTKSNAAQPSVALYARISAADKRPDATYDTDGIRRQLEDCRRYCTQHGWERITVYDENNRSASSYARKRRTVFDRMLANVAAGNHDVIVVAELSRYTREPRIVEDLIDAAGAIELVSVMGGGNYDLTTGQGKMRIRNEALFAASYSDFISDKVRRKKEQLVADGESSGGSRAFGYLGPDMRTGRKAGMKLETKEANAIRKAVEDVLAGATLSSVARRWNEQGFRTPRRGSLWGVPSVRFVLTNPRNAGITATRIGRDGNRIRYEKIAKAKWPAIITEQQLDRITRLLNDPNRRRKNPPRRSLLTGLIRCECGALMASHGAGYLRCHKQPETAACGQNGIPVEPLAELITAAVLYRLDTRKFWKAIDAAARRERKQIGESPADVEAEITELDEQVGAGVFTIKSAATIRKGLNERLERARAAAGVDVDPAVEQFRDADIGAAWKRLDEDRRRGVLKALIESITVTRRRDDDKHRRGLWDPDRLDVHWRV
jgi:DNA invertase Pin-like site-specific DNA recombinase